MSNPRIEDTRVHIWIQDMQENGNEFQVQLTENFEHYLENVDAFEEGDPVYTDLPHFDDLTGSVMHAAVKFGRSWAQNSEIHFVTGSENEFIDAFGIRGNAERLAETTDGYSVETHETTGRTPEEDIESMKSGDSLLLPQVGECLEYLLENEEAFEEENSAEIVQSMPHFSEEIHWILVFSALFGRLWEYSDPTLWVVLANDNTVEGVYTDATQAAYATEENPELRSEPLTPTDNDRNGETFIQSR